MKIAAQPNYRHAVIDTSDPLIETAEIDSITLAVSALGQDEGTKSRERISLRERIAYNKPETPCQRDFLPRKSVENTNKIQDQSLPPPKKRSIRVGKKSVYGTEDSHGNILDIATGYRLSDLAATQDDNQYLNQQPNANEWGGETLIPSQAQKFSNLMSKRRHGEDSLLVPRKRFSPGKRSRGSLNLGHTFDKELEWQHGDGQDDHVTPFPITDLDMEEHNHDLTPSELGSDLSSGTVLLKPTTVDIDGEGRQQDGRVSAPTAEADVPLSQGGPTTSFKYLNQGPWKTATPSESIATRQSWWSPCQKDPSLKSGSRKRVRRSLDVSLTGPHGTSAGKYLARAPGLQQKEKRIRSRSLSQSIDSCGKELKAQPPGQMSETRHTAFMVGRASGQKIQRYFAEFPSRACKDSREIIIPTSTPTSIISEDNFHAKRCPSSASELPPVPRISTIHSVAAPNGTFRSDESQEIMRAEVKNFSGDSDGSFHPSVLDQSDTPTHTIPQKEMVPTSPDTSDRPWIRREIPSSKYFPDDSSSLGRAGPMRQPFWIKYMGKLIICFPNNVNPGSYEVEVVARIWLSKADKNGWLNFIIPGLPYLDEPTAPGRFSFSLTTDLRYQIDRSLLEESYTCGPLAMGSSRFGPLPLLRLHSEILPSEMKREKFYFSPSDMLISPQHRNVLDSLSLEDGNPHNATVLWLLAEIKKAMFDCRSEDPLAFWFARLDFAQLRSAMMDILYQKKKPASVSLKDTSPSPKIMRSADLPNKVNRTDNTTQNDELSAKANGKIRLMPAYFAGLFTVDDPLKSEDLSKLAWNFDISVTRAMNGKLQCCIILEFSSRIPPLITVDGRDWLPNFAIINGNVATQMDWRETEDGDLALHHVKGLAAADTIKIELHFQEHTLAEGFSSHGGESRDEFRLPNVVDKAILGGTLRCDLDNTIITLVEPSCEDVHWRTDLLDGRMSTALPKLNLGYTMYMAVQKRVEKTGDDLESLPDMQSVLDLSSPTPQPKHRKIPDVIDLERPPVPSHTSWTPSSQGGVSTSLPDKEAWQGEPTAAAMAIQSAETDLIDFHASRIADPVRPRTAHFSIRRLMLYLVLAFLMIRFHLQLREERLTGEDAYATLEGCADEMNSAEDRYEAIGIGDEDDRPMIETMHGSQWEGEVNVRETDAAAGSDRGGMSWKDVIDHALGWQQLEG